MSLEQLVEKFADLHRARIEELPALTFDEAMIEALALMSDEEELVTDEQSELDSLVADFEQLAAEAELPNLEELLARVNDLEDPLLQELATEGYWAKVQRLRNRLDGKVFGFLEFMKWSDRYVEWDFQAEIAFFSNVDYMKRLYLLVNNLQQWQDQHQRLSKNPVIPD